MKLTALSARYLPPCGLGLPSPDVKQHRENPSDQRRCYREWPDDPRWDKTATPHDRPVLSPSALSRLSWPGVSAFTEPRRPICRGSEPMVHRSRREASALRRRAQILVACTREHDWSRPVENSAIPRERDELLALVEHARIHGVESCLYLSLRNIEEMDPAASAYLEAAYFSALQMHLRARRGLGEVRDVLDAAHVPWLVIKGPALADAIYSRSDLRSYVDLDIVVPPDAFGRAVEALERDGNELRDRNWGRVRADGRAQVHVVLKSGMSVDLHWNLINSTYFRSVFPIETTSLFDRARSVQIGDTDARTLGYADTLVHLAIHSCRSGGNRLLWLKDLEQTVLFATPSWDEVIDRSREWRATLAVATMLSRTARTLGIHVPREVMDALAPRSWQALVAATERRARVERSTGQDTLALLLNYSVRSDARTSLRDLEKRSWKWIRGARPLKLNRQANHADGGDPLTEVSPAEDADRTRYFDGVALQARDGPALPP